MLTERAAVMVVCVTSGRSVTQGETSMVVLVGVRFFLCVGLGVWCGDETR